MTFVIRLQIKFLNEAKDAVISSVFFLHKEIQIADLITFQIAHMFKR